MFCLLLLLGLMSSALAESGIDAWLRYARLPPDRIKGHLDGVPRTVLALNGAKGGPIESAVSELQKGLYGILGVDVDSGSQTYHCATKGSIVIATLHEYAPACSDKMLGLELEEDGFWLSISHNSVTIIGQNERGALYGSFEYLSMIAQGNFSEVAYSTNPSAPIRWVNQWDNMNDTGTHGSIERGYGGRSIFFDGKEHINEDLTRVTDYGRLLASIRVNGIIINNVNADPLLLTGENLAGVKKIADLFRPWGVRVGISLNFASPQLLGDLDTFDPLDESVIQWWTDKSDQIYDSVPDLLGYLIKANSEGQPGPITYNRTLAEGANMFAKTIDHYGGIIMFRAFVYNQLNESEWKADRANAAVEFFKELDGEFDDNVVVQIKYGPIDFQVREPPSPLFANLPKTAMAMELQITQEYLGQQCHLVYLPPLWQTILGFDMRVNEEQSYVKDIVSGNVFNKKLGGYAGVANLGLDKTWIGSHLAMSNLYAYGRLAWDPNTDSVDIIDDWTRLTFGLSKSIREAVRDMSMRSWPAYEGYSGNLGIQTLADILYTHYGPGPESMDNNGWGQWTRPDKLSIGMDRTVANGTGNAGQYPKEVAKAFEHTRTTPDDLMLWFHHVPYKFRLHSGKTVIQHFYDAHYKGAQTAQGFPATWESLRGRIDDERFDDVLYRLEYQAGHSIVWRDAIVEFYRNISGIPDSHNRVRHHPHRIEAERMTLKGYQPVDVTPSEMASQYRAIVTNSTGTATTKLTLPSGRYNIAVNYYDILGGQAHYKLRLNGKVVGSWKGNAEEKLGHAFSEFLDGHSAIRITFKNVKIRRGDVLTVEGTADGAEQAPLDYISVLPHGVID